MATLHARVQGEGEHGPKAATTQLLIVTTWEAGHYGQIFQLSRGYKSEFLCENSQLLMFAINSLLKNTKQAKQNMSVGQIQHTNWLFNISTL